MSRINNRTWSDEELIEAVKSAKCIADVVRKLGLVVGGSFRNIKSHIKRLDLDTSHFLNKSELMIRCRGGVKIKSEAELFSGNGSLNDYKRVKNIILRKKLLAYECAICSLSNWNDKDITLQMDHINGNKYDNRLENLRFLCPNCHSQTENFCGRNILGNSLCKYNTGKTFKIKHICKCGVEITATAKMCRKCNAESKQKIKWIDLQVLLEMVKELGFSEVGRRFGVSDNAIRKHIRVYSSMVE